MSEEEKEAIEKIKIYVLDDLKCQAFYSNEKCCEDCESKCMSIKSIEIVLNLIEKQQKEIEDKQDEINVLEAQKESIENQFEQAKKENKQFKNDYISKSKIKEKIKEYENILNKCNNKKDIDRIKCLNERILAYRELL